MTTSTTDRIMVSRFRAAELLSISLPYLDQNVRRGKLTAVKLGRRTLFARTELDRFAKDNCRPAHSAR